MIVHDYVRQHPYLCTKMHLQIFRLEQHIYTYSQLVMKNVMCVHLHMYIYTMCGESGEEQ